MKYYEITDNGCHVGWVSELYVFAKEDERILQGKTDVNILIGQKDAVDLTVVRHGHWVKNDEGDFHCSVCNAIVESDEKSRHYWGYCYHCGAKMDGGGRG